MKLYQQLADHFSSLIRAGTLKAGERMSSVRATAREGGISPATVIHAYELLEGAGLIETRPRSGFYVGSTLPGQPAPPRSSRPSTCSTRLNVSELVFEVLETLGDRSVVPFGSAFPDPTLCPLARLGALAGCAARRRDPCLRLNYGHAWSAQSEKAIRVLGLLRGGRSP